MKRAVFVQCLRATLLLFGLTTAIVGLAVPAQSAVLLEVNVQNPAAVTITATSSPALVNDSSGTSGDGATLLLFFIGQGFPLTGNEISTMGLSAAGMTQPYSDLSNTFALLSARDINLYRIGVGTQTFTLLTPAFNGSMVMNLGTAAGLLPSVGAIGNIVVGDTVSGSGAVIGQWQIVPEPGATLLVGIGLVMVTASRRRRH